MEYYCKVHNKKYASYKSLWFHNFKYHKIESKPEVDDGKPESKSISKLPINNEFNCRKCNKNFKFKQSRWKHEKKCTVEPIKKEEIDEIKKEMLEYKVETQKEIAEYKAEMLKLRDIIQKSLKIHPKQLQKINNTLNNTTNNITNNITNNNIFVQLGHEDLINELSNKQKMRILNRNVMGLNDLVELIHVSGKYKKFMNVYITNLQNSIAYRYDEKEKKFIAVNKKELLKDLIDSRMYDIEKFYDEVEDILEADKAKDIKRFIERMKKEDDYLNGLKKDEIKLILYNNRDKIVPKEEDEIKELEV